MTETINANSNEFAVATGSNVDVGGGVSHMDGAAGDHSGLVITSNDGDDNPYVFDPGDSYDISFNTGASGTTTLDDAQVIGSDYMPFYDAWCITFEGADDDGNIVQVVWSPGFDLDTWRTEVSDNGGTGAFTQVDEDSETTYSVPCFTQDTRIETAHGPVPIGCLRVGDRVATLDGGLQPVQWIGAQTVSGLGRLAPILFQPGAIGNARALRLSPQHRILHASALAELYFGTSEVLIPAKSLVNNAAISFAPVPRVTYVHLLLPQHHIIRAEGAECESLFCGDMVRNMRDPDAGAELRQVFGGLLPNMRNMHAARPMLRYQEAILLTGAGRKHAALRTLIAVPLPIAA